MVCRAGHGHSTMTSFGNPCVISRHCYKLRAHPSISLVCRVARLPGVMGKCLIPLLGIPRSVLDLVMLLRIWVSCVWTAPVPRPANQARFDQRGFRGCLLLLHSPRDCILSGLSREQPALACSQAVANKPQAAPCVSHIRQRTNSNLLRMETGSCIRMYDRPFDPFSNSQEFGGLALVVV